MATFNIFLTSAAAAVVLSGCVGGSESEEFLTGSNLLALTSRAQSAVSADEADLPQTASLSGFIFAEVGSVITDENRILGDMQVDANFQTGRMSGTASNLGVYSSETAGEIELVDALGGTLSLDASVSGTEFSGDISGALHNVDLGADNDTGLIFIGVRLDVDGAFGADDEGLLAAGEFSGYNSGDVRGGYTGTGNESRNMYVSGGFLVAE